MSREFLLETVDQTRKQRLLSEEHFSVDGTLLEAWALVKSFRPRDEDEPPDEGADAIRRWTFGESHAATTPIGPPLIRRPGWPGKARVKKQSSASAPTC